MRISHDELVLALISLVRATHPRMLVQERDGFSIDFEALSRLTRLGPDERLLIKMRAAIEPPSGSAPDVATSAQASPAPPPEAFEFDLSLTSIEGRRLATTLTNLERLQQWPEDVLAMSRTLRERLATISEA